LEERVHRHLSDINSVITEDDIKNVKMESSVGTQTSPASPVQPLAKNETAQPRIKNKRKKRKDQEQKKENEIDATEKHATPWNILSEGYD
jgi:hypothetical protein